MSNEVSSSREDGFLPDCWLLWICPISKHPQFQSLTLPYLPHLSKASSWVQVALNGETSDINTESDRAPPRFLGGRASLPLGPPLGDLAPLPCNSLNRGSPL